MSDKKYKSANITIFGVLDKVTDHENCRSITLKCVNDLNVFCYLQSDLDFEHLKGKRVKCSGSMRFRPLYAGNDADDEDEGEEEPVGFETVYTIFKISDAETKVRSKGKKSK